jgi:hypothetical protein
MTAALSACVYAIQKADTNIRKVVNVDRLVPYVSRDNTRFPQTEESGKDSSEAGSATVSDEEELLHSEKGTIVSAEEENPEVTGSSNIFSFKRNIRRWLTAADTAYFD